MARSTPQLLSLLSPRVPHQLSLDAGLVFYVIVAEKVFEKEISNYNKEIKKLEVYEPEAKIVREIYPLILYEDAACRLQ